MLDERLRVGWDLQEPRHAAARRAGIGIDAGKPGDEVGPQQGEPVGTIAGNRRISVGRFNGLIDRGFDRAFDPAEIIMVRQFARGMILDVKLLQGEASSGSASVALPASISESNSSTRRSSILSARDVPSKASRRPLDHFGICALRNGRQSSLLDANELFGHLQSLVIVGADGEHGNDSRRVGDQEIAQHL